jgi:hypothetical protein
MFKIFDWAGNPILPEHEFISFEDGWERVYKLCADLYGEDYDDEELGEYQVIQVNND